MAKMDGFLLGLDKWIGGKSKKYFEYAINVTNSVKHNNTHTHQLQHAFEHTAIFKQVKILNDLIFCRLVLKIVHIVNCAPSPVEN